MFLVTQERASLPDMISIKRPGLRYFSGWNNGYSVENLPIKKKDILVTSPTLLYCRFE
jgi:hypothetical protein